MTTYNQEPNYKAASWALEVQYDIFKLHPDDAVIALNIINEKEVVGIKGFYELLFRLSKAGFRGEVVNRMQLGLSTLVVLNSKVENEKP